MRGVADDGVRDRSDYIATEEPLEIHVAAGGKTQTVAVTMRTPGADFELAMGFLFTEGVIANRDDVERISYCTDPDIDKDQWFNIVTVALGPRLDPDLTPLDRHFHITSACGVCGKASIDSLRVRGCAEVDAGPQVASDVILGLPDKLREAQGLFESTGGLHAAGLFSATGDLLALREDVGRHNALDKLVGWALMDQRIPLAQCIVMVSGRSSFEIVQKSVTAGAAIVCAVSAPSSLAVDTAREFGVTLVGFLRDNRFNIYAGEERIEVTQDRLVVK